MCPRSRTYPSPPIDASISSHNMCPILAHYQSQTSIALPKSLLYVILSRDKCPAFAHIRRKLRLRPFPIDPIIHLCVLELVGSTFSLPLYACVGLLDNETPTKPSTVPSFLMYAPSFAHIRRKLRLRPYPIDPPSTNLISRTNTCEIVSLSLPLYACVGLLDNETPTVKCVLMMCAPSRTYLSQSYIASIPTCM